MDDYSLEEREPFVDLETGGSGCEEDTKDEPISVNRRAKNMNSYKNSGKSSEDPHENIELLIDKKFRGESVEHVPLIEKTQVKEKRKMTISKKAPKPPLPPQGPILDTADLKLVKEISELAMKKRARVERMKELKKMKAAKSSSSNSSKSSSSLSSNSSISAMVVTLLFFLIIIFQGFCSRDNSSSNFQVSPGPAAAANGLISIQLYNNLLESDGIGPSSESPNSVEQTSGSEFRSPG